MSLFVSRRLAFNSPRLFSTSIIRNSSSIHRSNLKTIINNTDNNTDNGNKSENEPLKQKSKYNINVKSRKDEDHSQFQTKTKKKTSSQPNSQFQPSFLSDIVESWAPVDEVEQIKESKLFDYIKSINKNQKLWIKLNWDIQQQIIQYIESEQKLKNWNDLNNDLKKIIFYISYGEWGPRNKSDEFKIGKNGELDNFSKGIIIFIIIISTISISRDFYIGDVDENYNENNNVNVNELQTNINT